ncbi:MAG: M20/M25/M40 family metallo-hydrolase [Candidatus Eiseniibacteriota bacterium]
MTKPVRGPRLVSLQRVRVLACAAAIVLAPAVAFAPVLFSAEPAPPDAAYRDETARIVGAAITSDRAWTRLSELCDGIGHRLSGSKSLERAVVWARDAMRADGLDSVWLQPVRVPYWRRGPKETAEILGKTNQRLDVLALGRSVGTPKGGLTAPVVAVSSFHELNSLPASAVKGKIVLYDVPFTKYGETVRYRSNGARRAAARGAVAVLVRSVTPTSLRTPHTGTTSAYPDSFPKIPAAAVTLEDAAMIRRLIARGEQVRVRLEMHPDTLPWALSHNVIGELRGRERPEEVVVVGGHLDSWDVGQGAQDDGGGCVISMEALRLLKDLGLRPRRTLRCVLWTNEENGIEGGKAYAKEYGSRNRHVAAIESDGGVERPVGFNVRMFRVGTDSTDTTRTQVALGRLKPFGPLLAGIGAGTIGDAGGGADIEPLMKLGVPGVEHQTTMANYFDWHHTHADMMDKVDPVELRKNVAAMAVMAYVLAEMPGTLADSPAVPAQAPGAAAGTGAGARSSRVTNQ